MMLTNPFFLELELYDKRYLIVLEPKNKHKI